MQNPYIILAILCLVVATYMFLAMKFTQLLFIFRFKAGFAKLFGISDDDNKSFGEKLGMIIAPIIGVCALAGSVKCVLLWNEEGKRIKQYADQKTINKKKTFDDVVAALELKKVKEVFKGGNYSDHKLMLPSEMDRVEIINLLKELGQSLKEEDVSCVDSTPNYDKQWKVRLICNNGAYAQLNLQVKKRLVTITRNYKKGFPSATGFIHISIPPKLHKKFDAILDMQVKKKARNE